jgi:hypothetical protein
MMFLTRLKVAEGFNVFQIIQIIADRAIVMDEWDDEERLSPQEIIWMAQSRDISMRTDREAMLAHCNPVREYKGE